MPSLSDAFMEAILASQKRGERDMPTLPGKTFSPIGASPGEEQEKARQQALATQPTGQSIRLPGPPRVKGVLPSPSPLLGGPGGAIGGLGRAGLAGLAGALLGQDESIGRFGPGPRPSPRPSLPGLPPMAGLPPIQAPGAPAPIKAPGLEPPVGRTPDMGSPIRTPGGPQPGKPLLPPIPIPSIPSLPGGGDMGPGTISAPAPELPAPQERPTPTPSFQIVEPNPDVYAPGEVPGSGGAQYYAGPAGDQGPGGYEGYEGYGGGANDAQLEAMLEAIREGRLQ